jgi:signal transduction histidine kinase
MNGPSGAAQPQASHRGYGLMGMRERATMVGGSLETGHTPQGGWSTRAVVPVDRRVRA